MSHGRTLSRSLVALAVAAGGVALAVPASAAPAGAPAVSSAVVLAAHDTRVERRDTVLRVDRGTADVLRDRRITLRADDGARARRSDDRLVEVAIPVRRIDARAQRVDHDGRLVFGRDSRKVTLDDFRVEDNRLTARAGGKRFDLFTLEGGTRRFEGRDRVTLTDVTAKLTDDGARRLNDALGVSVFKKGLTVATVSVRKR